MFNDLPWPAVAVRLRLRAGWVLLLIAGGIGCGAGESPALVPVRGRIDAALGDPASLAGHIVEIEQVDDATVRGFAAIDGTGRFSFQSLRKGKVRDGVPAGAYRARLVLVADDEPAFAEARKRVPERCLSFKSSGIGFQVPLEAELVIGKELR